MAKGKYEQIKKLFPKIKHLVEIDGYSEKDLINYLPISKNTFYKYKTKHRDFRDLIEKSRDVLVKEVEKSFIKRAIGYEYEEIHTEQIYEYVNGKATPVGMKVKKVKKRMHGSVPAQLAILKRLAGWREEEYTKQEIKEINTSEEARIQAINELLILDKEDNDDSF